MSSPVNHQALADMLWTAHEKRQPIDPIRDIFGPGAPDAEKIAQAYAVQAINIRRQVEQGRRIVGRKAGLTAKAVQAQLGVAQPDFGTLLDDMAIGDGEEIDTSLVVQPKVEAEIALVLERDLPYERHSVADILSATAYAVAAIEIVGSRIANWNIKILDTVADNASSGLFVLGTQPVPLRKLDLYGCAMAMDRNGEVVSTGTGAACLGNPINATRWLADTMVRVGSPLRAGDVIMTGALGPMVMVRPGEVFTSRIDGLAPVRAIFK